MIFRQLFEPLSSTYTYLLGCEETGQAVLIDPVIVAIDRDLAEVKRLGLTLAYTLDTHIHADHITAGLELKNKIDRSPRISANRRPDGRVARRRHIGPALRRQCQRHPVPSGRERLTLAQGEMIAVAENAGNR